MKSQNILPVPQKKIVIGIIAVLYSILAVWVLANDLLQIARLSIL